MKKNHILNEICRTANKENNQALGEARLEKETGIQRKDWYGIHWANYGEAVKEAGCKPSKFQVAYDEERIEKKLIVFIHENNKFPTNAQLKLERRRNKDFPSHGVFTNLGKKHERARKVIEYCEKNNIYPDVIEICLPLCKPDENNEGFVYLIKHDKDYKIGKAKHAGKHNYDLGLIMPREIKEIHKIATDDPAGIEKYWHDRFKDKKMIGKKRLKGERFNLTSQDVKAFKRRKFM
ncbi:MAG: GIY-YIG nuclease family protein [Planctomycetota bacterium]|jgi:transposase